MEKRLTSSDTITILLLLTIAIGIFLCFPLSNKNTRQENEKATGQPEKTENVQVSDTEMPGEPYSLELIFGNGEV